VRVGAPASGSWPEAAPAASPRVRRRRVVRVGGAAVSGSSGSARTAEAAASGPVARPDRRRLGLASALASGSAAASGFAGRERRAGALAVGALGPLRAASRVEASAPASVPPSLASPSPAGAFWPDLPRPPRLRRLRLGVAGAASGAAGASVSVCSDGRSSSPGGVAVRWAVLGCPASSFTAARVGLPDPVLLLRPRPPRRRRRLRGAPVVGALSETELSGGGSVVARSAPSGALSTAAWFISSLKTRPFGKDRAKRLYPATTAKEPGYARELAPIERSIDSLRASDRPRDLRGGDDNPRRFAREHLFLPRRRTWRSGPVPPMGRRAAASTRGHVPSSGASVASHRARAPRSAPD
jgi:hypothetical protein